MFISPRRQAKTGAADWLELRACMAVALRKPDSMALGLLRAAAAGGCTKRAGKRHNGGAEPVWAEFMSRIGTMPPSERASWESYTKKTQLNRSAESRMDVVRTLVRPIRTCT